MTLFACAPSRGTGKGSCKAHCTCMCGCVVMKLRDERSLIARSSLTQSLTPNLVARSIARSERAMSDKMSELVSERWRALSETSRIWSRFGATTTS